jgi:adenylosuccinate lyase
MKTWEDKKDFKTLLKSDKDITKWLDNELIDSLFDLDKVMININKIFKRLGMES